MTTEIASLRDGLMRQRRLLVAVSLVLTFFVTAVGRIGELSVLGNTVSIDHPDRALWFLWIAWGYLIVRYYQYFRELGPEEVRQTVDERLEVLANRFGQARYLANYQDRDLEKDAVSKKLYILDAGVVPADHPFDELLSNTVKIRKLTKNTAWTVIITGSIVVTGRDGSTTSGMANSEECVTLAAMTCPRFRAACWAAFHRTAFSEYMLPFLVALLPAVYVCGGWCLPALKWIGSHLTSA